MPIDDELLLRTRAIRARHEVACRLYQKSTASYQASHNSYQKSTASFQAALKKVHIQLYNDPSKGD